MKYWFSRALEVLFYATIMGTLALLITWYFDGDPRELATRRVVTPTVAPGGELSVRVVAWRQQTCGVKIQRAIVDSEGTLFASPAFTTTRDKGTASVTIHSTVPSAAAPGPATYRVTMEWQCNPLQKFWPRVEELPELAFTIVEPVKGSARAFQP